MAIKNNTRGLAPLWRLGRGVGSSKLSLLLANIVSLCSPHSRGYRLRRALYRWSGVRLHPSVLLAGGIRFCSIDVSIGQDSYVGFGTTFLPTASAPVIIGERCDISSEVVFHCGSHDLGPAVRRAGPGWSEPIIVGNGSWVGVRATFIAGARVGAGCVVAAGALVNGTFDDNVMIAGIPARVVKRL